MASFQPCNTGICVVSQASRILFRSADRFQYPLHADTESDWCCGTEWGWLTRLGFVNPCNTLLDLRDQFIQRHRALTIPYEEGPEF